jgi:hypothetical protein
MNKGLRLATGDYVWFLNSGDKIFGPDTVKDMVEGIKGDPGMVYGGTMIIDSEGRDVGDRRLKAPQELTWKSFRQGMIVCHQSMLVRRDIAPEYDMQYRISADIDWAIRSARAAGKIQNAGQVLARFLEGGVSRKNIRQSLKERFRIMTRHYGFLPTLLRHFLFAFRLGSYFLKHRRIQ